jgi:hypothetical protein
MTDYSLHLLSDDNRHEEEERAKKGKVVDNDYVKLGEGEKVVEDEEE